MTEPLPAPRITALQREWLLELGMERPLLARWMAPAGAADAPGPGAVRTVSTGPAAPAVPTGRAASDTPNAPEAPDESAARAVSDAPDAQDESVARAVSAIRGRSGGAAAGPRAEKAPTPTPASVQAVGPLAAGLDALREQVRQCRACALCEGRSQPVFGEGAQEAPDWMVIGEAPGDLDDREGRPFQGDAGELLAGMLAAMGVKAEGRVFFTNLVKCRPLGNRPPSSDEIAACLPYLRRQVALLAPRRILALGRLPAQILTGGKAGLDQLRGTVHEFEGEDGRRIPLVVTHHPTSLLLQPQHKPDVWRDLILARGVAA
jgi:DNA polymerase